MTHGNACPSKTHGKPCVNMLGVSNVINGGFTTSGEQIREKRKERENEWERKEGKRRKEREKRKGEKGMKDKK